MMVDSLSFYIPPRHPFSFTLCNNLDDFYGLLTVFSIVYMGSLSQITPVRKGMLMELIALM